MKKAVYLIISCALFLNYAKAQNTSFGITAGAVFTSYKAAVESVSITSRTKAGFTAGAVVSIGMGKYISLQPALNFVQKGGTFKDEGSADKTTLNYLELPLNIVYNTSGAKGKFFAGAGPCFSMGLSGKDKYKDDYYDETTDIKFGSGTDDDLKPLEVCINIIAGYQLKNGLFIAANYNAGLNNIANGDSFYSVDTKYHNRYFGVRIGCMFGKKTKQQ